MVSGNLPCTAEILTPPFSKTRPFSITLVLPPPPSGRSQISSLNVASPSIASSFDVMVSCKS